MIGIQDVLLTGLGMLAERFPQVPQQEKESSCDIAHVLELPRYRDTDESLPKFRWIFIPNCQYRQFKDEAP